MTMYTAEGKRVDSSRRRFLVIDDDPIFLAVAESLLLSIGGTTVFCASDGEEGLQALRDAAPAVDMIILDLNMPRLDGLGFLRAVAQTGFAGEIVISSGEAAAIVNSARHMANQLGVRISGTLQKPMTPDALAALLSADPSGQKLASQATVVSSFAPADGVLVPFYQPQYDLLTRKVIGTEALARFQANTGAILGPGFIFDHISTHAELMDVTARIADAALRDLSHWHAIGLQTRLSINMDTRALEDPELWSMLMRFNDDYAIAPDRIVFEMTETALPRDMSRLIEVLTRLRMKGYGVSLDDFGTGGANFELLRVCPFSELKIDQTIVQSAATERHSMRFLEFCATTARELGLELIAEGIETTEHEDLVLSHGITWGQGYLLSQPLPADGMERVLAGSAGEVRQ
jgi:EAL domain-containing protein (putative c-di-GMP-specific phosphodiesterase class I)